MRPPTSTTSIGTVAAEGALAVGAGASGSTEAVLAGAAAIGATGSDGDITSRTNSTARASAGTGGSRRSFEAHQVNVLGCQPCLDTLCRHGTSWRSSPSSWVSPS